MRSMLAAPFGGGDRLDLLSDPRFASYADRRANWGKLMDELEAWSQKARKCRLPQGA